MGLEEIKALIGIGGPSAVLMWVVYQFVTQIRPALDRNTEALGMVAQALGKGIVQSGHN